MVLREGNEDPLTKTKVCLLLVGARQVTSLGNRKEREGGFGHWDRTQSFRVERKRRGSIRVINPKRDFGYEKKQRGLIRWIKPQSGFWF